MAAFDRVPERGAAVGSHYLRRGAKNLQARVLERLADGRTRLVVAAHDPRRPREILHWLRMRQVHALWLMLALGGDRLSARQHPPLTVRFWAQAR